MDCAKPELWVGIVLYENSSKELSRLCASLELCRQHPGTPAFCVRWLDNSPDDSLRAALAVCSPASHYVHAGANLGFGAAHNRLMAEAFAAGARAYLCLNPDAVLHPACIRELVAEAQRAGPRAGLVEARLFPDEHLKPYDPGTHETPWCSGCALLVTRALFEASGGFDPRFFMYCEDVDLSWRARALGFSTRLAPEALVHHYTMTRAPSRRRELSVRHSGALLAAKYGHRGFLELCLDEYVAQGGTPLAPPPLERPGRALARVADFRHLFDFAEPRW